MKNQMLLLVLFSTITFHSFSNELTTSTETGNHVGLYLNGGVGASTLGVPFFISLDIPLSKENQFFNVGISRNSRKERYDYYWLYGDEVTWQHTITGYYASWNMDADEYLGDLLPEEMQLYGGIQVDYFIVKTKLVDGSNGQSIDYDGATAGGIGISGIVGARYFINDRLAINAVVGGGTRASSGRVGISLKIK